MKIRAVYAPRKDVAQTPILVLHDAETGGVIGRFYVDDMVIDSRLIADGRVVRLPSDNGVDGLSDAYADSVETERWDN